MSRSRAWPTVSCKHAIEKYQDSMEGACASPRGGTGVPGPPVAAGAPPPDENSADGITCLRSSTFM